MTPNASIASRASAFHEFLIINQPLSPEHLPPTAVLEAGETYNLPFSFVVPHALPNTCKHKTASPRVKSDHLRLPPSLGDSETAGHGTTTLDDLAPDMTRISYGVRVRVYKQRENEDKEIILSEKTRRVRIAPAVEEQPPVDVDESEEYCLRREKGIRKGFLKPKTGKLIMEASQPKALELLPPRSECEGSPTTMVSVQLRFDPFADSAEPPKLGQLSSKLRVGTFFASCARENFPSQKTMAWDATQGLYVDVLTLSSRCMSATEWLRHEPHTSTDAALLRRGSGMNLSGPAKCPQPSAKARPDLPFYTAQLLIPVSLPKGKLLVPTFHSCLVSRVYNLELTLSLPPTASATLKVPLQLSASSASGVNPGALGLQDSMVEGDLSGDDEDFLPQGPSAPAYTERNTGGPVIQQPGQGGRQGGDASPAAPPPPPPNYSSLAPRTGGFRTAPSFRASLPLVT